MMKIVTAVVAPDASMGFPWLLFSLLPLKESALANAMFASAAVTGV
jgi:hypothetical protein